MSTIETMEQVAREQDDGMSCVRVRGDWLEVRFIGEGYRYTYADAKITREDAVRWHGIWEQTNKSMPRSAR